MMVAVTIALAYYAHATMEEGKKNRRKASIEKQLERLYNPLYEFLSILEKYRLEHNPKMEVVGVSTDNFERTLRIFQNYGHYLDPGTHRKVSELVSEIVPSQDGQSRFLRVPHIQSCLAPITSKRTELKKELEFLS
jgi:CRISPR/Cas system-associated protein Cas10 (large subunit of type III CRISPR-Cas system)